MFVTTLLVKSLYRKPLVHIGIDNQSIGPQLNVLESHRSYLITFDQIKIMYDILSKDFTDILLRSTGFRNSCEL